MKPRLVLGTNNRGKLREYEDLLAGSGFDLVTPADLGLQFDPEETGSTFAENATLKAAEASRISGLPALADDSVIVLGDAPGGRRDWAALGQGQRLARFFGVALEASAQAALTIADAGPQPAFEIAGVERQQH